jgi:Domain of unknown function (DUF4082)
MRISEYKGRTDHTVIVRTPIEDKHVLVQGDMGSILVVPSRYSLGDVVAGEPLPPLLPEGIQGPPGDTGPSGPVGAQGPQGVQGAMLHVGSGLPDADFGNEGDTYLDEDTSVLYGPKEMVSGGVSITGYGAKAPTQWFPTGAYSMGNNFRITIDTQITALRLYRHADELPGSRQIRLYSPAGTLLAETVSAVESGPGWIQADLPTPFPVAANAELWVVADRPQGYVYDSDFATTAAEVVWLATAYKATLGVFPDVNGGAFTHGVDVVIQESADIGFWPVIGSLIGPPGPKGDPALWVELTQAEYDALPVKDPNTLYIIIG